MSAWLVGKPHIDALVWAFLEYAAGTIDTSQLAGRDELGQMLMDECQKSVSYRYPSHIPELPGWWEDYVEPYSYAPPLPLPSLYETHKNICCYDYQSCEHETWEASRAYKMVTDLRSEVCQRLEMPEETVKDRPEWNVAPWGWGEE